MQAVFWSRNAYSRDYDCILRNPQCEVKPKLHYHDFYEIVIYLGNAGKFLIKDKEYAVRYGDIALINIFSSHMLSYNDIYYERFSICIDPNLLLSFNTSSCNVLSIFSENSRSYPILHLNDEKFEKYLGIINKFKTINLSHGEDIFKKALLHLLVSYLYDDCYSGIDFGQIDSVHIGIIAQLIEYINDNLSENLSLERLGSIVNYSPSYICRIFKKFTGYTIVNYIVEKRIEKAISLLREDIPLNQVADKVGFNNYSYFYKTFKKNTGFNPQNYRLAVH